VQWIGTIVRFLVSAFVLLVVGYLVPQFTVGGFWSAMFLALVIALIGWVIESVIGTRATPFGRGVVGFVTSVAVIYFAQFLVAGVSATLLGAIMAALVIGIVDLFIPLSTPFDTRSGTGTVTE
jgi:putative membrane protein